MKMNFACSFIFVQIIVSHLDFGTEAQGNSEMANSFVDDQFLKASLQALHSRPYVVIIDKKLFFPNQPF